MDSAANTTKDSVARLGLWDTVFLIVGIIIGVGIFETAPDVFAKTTSPWHALFLWAAGGFLSLIGAFCFAELASTYPRSGGEYVYLTKAYGRWSGFLFAWAQLAIIRAGGSIGAVAYIFAAYSGELFGWSQDDTWNNCALAIAVVVALTAINVLGVYMGKWTQNALTVLKVLSIGGILAAGFLFGKGLAAETTQRTAEGFLVRRNSEALVLRQADFKDVTYFVSAKPIVHIDGEKGQNRVPYTAKDLKQRMRVKVYLDKRRPQTVVEVHAHSSVFSGLAIGLIFVMWTFAGWHEAAYVSAEVRNKRRNIPAALLLGTIIVTVLYLLINLAYIAGLGFIDAGKTETIAADVLALAFGSWGRTGMSLLVMISCLGAINGMIFTSSRIYAEMGKDHPLVAPLGKWHEKLGTPVISLLVQGVLTVGFILFVGLFFKGRDGFNALVACTAAVFWIFFLLTGIAVFVLRWKDPTATRPFSVPLYPLTPALFCIICAAMLVASVRYDVWKTLIGLGILAAGLPLYLLSNWMKRNGNEKQ